MASLQFKVTRKPCDHEISESLDHRYWKGVEILSEWAFLVTPSLPTLKEFLCLSNIDDQATLRFHGRNILFYPFSPLKKGEDPARVIREALAKILVMFYYPFAGRVRDAPDGKLVVECTGEGVMFVEADADVAPGEFGDLQPPFPCCQDLLHDVAFSITNSPPLFIQLCSWCARTVASLTASSRDEDKFWVSQLSGCNGTVVSTLLSCLLVVEVNLGKRSNIQSMHLMGPSSDWLSQSKPIYGTHEMLLQKLVMFLEFRAS